MTYYRTRRTLGSVTWSGAIAGPAFLGPENDEGDVNPNGRAVKGFCFSASGAGVNCFGSQSSDDGPYNLSPSSAATRPNGFAWNVGCDGHGTDVTWDSGTVVDTIVLPDVMDGGYDLSMSGSWSIEAECEEVFTIDGAAFPSNPNYGGTPSDDWPPQAGIALILLCRVGSRISASVSCGGASASLGGTVATAFVINPVIGLSVQSFARGTGNNPSLTAAASISGKLTVDGVDEPISGSVSHSGTRYSGTATGGTTSVSVSTDVTVIGPSSELATGGGEATRRANMEIALRGPNGAYPAAIGATFYGPAGGPVDANAPCTQSVVQEHYTVTVSYYGSYDFVTGATNTASSSKDDRAPLYCFLRPAALSALGEDPRLWRTLQRAFYRAGMSLAQASTLTLDSGSASATGPSETIVRSYANYSGSYVGQSLNGYRYMRLALTADADGQPATVIIGGKFWFVTVNVSGHVDIDLLSPSNNAASMDATDSHWPVPSEWGPLSGVQHCKTLTITALASGHTYALTGITLRRNSSVTFSALAEFQNWLLEGPSATVGDVTTTDYLRRYLLADTDGKQSLEWADASKQVSSAGGGTTTYGSASLASFVSNLNAAVGAPSDGWSGVDLCVAPPPCSGTTQDLDCFLNDNQPLMCAGGGGGSHDATGWTWWQAVDGSGGIALPLQMLFDQVTSWYGGCGDVFGFGGGTSALEMKAAAFLRGLSWGTVVDGSMAPVSGGTVALQLASDHSAAGSGTTDAQGRYVTGTAWGKGLQTYDTIAQVAPTPYPKISRPFVSRKWHRAAFGIGNTIGNPFNYVDRPGIAFYHETGIAGKKALYFRSPYAVPHGGWDVNRVAVYTADGSHAVADLRVTRDDRQTLIALFTVSLADGSSPDVYRSTSNDDGATWEAAAVAISGGKHPTLAIGSDGVFYFEVDAAYVDGGLGAGGVIKARRRTCGEVSWSDIYTFQDATATDIKMADDTFHVQQPPEDSLRWVLHCLEYGGSTTSRFESYDDAKTWTKVS